jgi:hypothetical protein
MVPVPGAMPPPVAAASGFNPLKDSDSVGDRAAGDFCGDLRANEEFDAG